MYRNTDILTGSEWGILIIVKGRRSTEFQLCRHFLASNTFSKRRAKKLDGVGPVDNRPSTDKLHHFVQKKKI